MSTTVTINLPPRFFDHAVEEGILAASTAGKRGVKFVRATLDRPAYDALHRAALDAGDQKGPLAASARATVKALEAADVPAGTPQLRVVESTGDAAEPVPAATRRAPRTWDATAAGEHKCQGACQQVKPAKSFPTTGKDVQRGVECRACRNERKAAAAQ